MPPEANVTGPNVQIADVPPAASVRLEVISKRADFLRAARAKRAGQPGFLLQARNRGDDAPPRVGFTCSKKIGNAVARNRAKRRLREIARIALSAKAQTGWDYVLVGRPTETVSRPFAQLMADLERAIAKVHT
ncbi:ribonuclease P protein component [Litoreibacter albidus]|uniref:Ribonuclease P protein component n=1 Tax=Litoreibacter albidus TaxID=670155 RepID=A0A1H2ZJH8_9RHOB|nr:ribonuclease P protein component [Litoreibacter albidus]SDX17590.1 ribonuclease P protein component [Litoreibacter albidus]